MTETTEEKKMKADYKFEYAPEWAKDISDDDLFHELRRRMGYKEAGWQESYRSAQHWRERAAELERQLEASRCSGGGR